MYPLTIFMAGLVIVQEEQALVTDTKQEAAEAYYGGGDSQLVV
jgi:hypothetical protein